MSTLIYTQKHRFFDDLVTLLTSLASFATQMDIYKHGHCEGLNLNRSMAIGGCTIPTDLIFWPHKVMPTLASKNWPTQLELTEAPLCSGMPKSISFELSSNEIKDVTALATQGSFIRYYETMISQVEKAFGSDRKNWPPIWNFGRVVRNAFAHGGKITFENPLAANVSWKNITYSPSDNGRQIMYKDIAYVEVVYLMDEMDAVLPSPVTLI